MDKTKIAIILYTIADSLRELKEAPSGHVYATLMGMLTLDQYNGMIDNLIRLGLVEREPSHLLRWTEPAAESSGARFMVAMADFMKAAGKV